MRIVEKKIWPEFFERVRTRKKNFEFRLADFTIAAGDKLRLREWDPKKNAYTGRVLTRTVKAVHTVQMFNFHPVADIKKYGVYGIELR
jgi:hypothetical protein